MFSCIPKPLPVTPTAPGAVAVPGAYSFPPLLVYEILAPPLTVNSPATAADKKAAQQDASTAKLAIASLKSLVNRVDKDLIAKTEEAELKSEKKCPSARKVRAVEEAEAGKLEAEYKRVKFGLEKAQAMMEKKMTAGVRNMSFALSVKSGPYVSAGAKGFNALKSKLKGDFSVEFPITQAGYDWWKETVYRAPGGPFETGQAPAFALKNYMKAEVETKLDQWIRDNQWAVDQLYQGENKTYGGTKVADIVFSFNNSRLIEALRARGGKIASNDFDGMREEETKINALFQDFDKLTVPTSAFITFESDDTANLADETKPDGIITMLNQNFVFQTCSEPTDIIWENRHFTGRDYFFRQLFAFTVIGILLFGSLIIIYIISAKSADMASVFPAVNCDGISEAYGDKLQTYAVTDFDYIEANPGHPSSGTLQDRKSVV